MSSRVGVAAADDPRLLSRDVTLSESEILDIIRDLSILLPVFHEGKGDLEFPFVATSAGPEPLDLREWELARSYRRESLLKIDGGTAHVGVPDFLFSFKKELDVGEGEVSIGSSLRAETFDDIVGAQRNWVKFTVVVYTSG